MKIAEYLRTMQVLIYSLSNLMPQTFAFEGLPLVR